MEHSNFLNSEIVNSREQLLPNPVSVLVYFIRETEGRIGCPNTRQQGSVMRSSETNHLLNIPQEVTLDEGRLRRSWAHQERRQERVAEDSPVVFLDSSRDFCLN